MHWHTTLVVLAVLPLAWAYQQGAAPAWHRSVVDEPPPFHRMEDVLSVVLGQEDGNATVEVKFTPDGDVEEACLRGLVMLALLGHGLPHTHLAATSGSSGKQATAITLELSPQEMAAVNSQYGTLTEMNHGFQVCITVARDKLRQQSIVFGSAGHLRLQYLRLGMVNGAMMAMLRHETSIGGVIDEVGEWECRQMALLQAALRPGDMAVDVGAHVGTHAVAMAHAVFPGGVVHAFEAQGGLLDVLSANAALAGTGNLVLHQAAVGGRAPDASAPAPTTIRMPVFNYTAPPVRKPNKPTSEAQSNFGGLSLAHAAQSAADLLQREVAFDSPTVVGTTTVPLVQLDDMRWYESPSSCPRVIKFDVEGMEEEALLGANRTLAACHPMLHIENNRMAVSARIIPLLHSLGYRMWWEVARFVDAWNYFGVRLDTVEEDMAKGRATEFSPNLFCVFSATPDAELPPLLQAALASMTPVQADRVYLHDYQVEGLELHMPQVTAAVVAKPAADMGTRWASAVAAANGTVEVHRVTAAHPVFSFLNVLYQQ